MEWYWGDRKRQNLKVQVFIWMRKKVLSREFRQVRVAIWCQRPLKPSGNSERLWQNTHLHAESGLREEHEGPEAFLTRFTDCSLQVQRLGEVIRGDVWPNSWMIDDGAGEEGGGWTTWLTLMESNPYFFLPFIFVVTKNKSCSCLCSVVLFWGFLFLMLSSQLRKISHKQKRISTLLFWVNPCHFLSQQKSCTIHTRVPCGKDLLSLLCLRLGVLGPL